MLTKLKLIPTPKEARGCDENGSFRTVSFLPTIHTEKSDWLSLTKVFTEYVRKLRGIALNEARGGIELIFEPTLDSGHYSIEISEDGSVRVSASDRDGAGYALSSLLQLMSEGRLPVLTLDDYPELDYRGIMVDLARRWHSFEQVLSYVDLCFLCKIKYLHLHFIDAESYTLPSKAYPALPTSNRHYTREQIDALVSYADERNITLIPEFEAPGHATAMVAAYPEYFACREGKGRENALVCAGKPRVFEHIDRLIGEICAMFPNSPYIHIGGDEALISHWNDCPDCSAYRKLHGLNDVKALYTDFVRMLTRIVRFYGRTPIVWEGFPKEGAERISRETVVIAWENYYHIAPELIDEGFAILNASWKPLYITPTLRWSPEEILDWNVYTFRHWWPKSVAHLNPIHLPPTEQVKGGQLCVWECEYDQEKIPVRENLPALAERTWTIRRLLEDDELKDRRQALDLLTEQIMQ